DDGHAPTGLLRERPREDVVLDPRVAVRLTTPGRDLIGLAPHQDGVDGLPELTHDGGRLVAPPEPVYRVVGAGQVVVQDVRPTERDLSHRWPPFERLDRPCYSPTREAIFSFCAVAAGPFVAAGSPQRSASSSAPMRRHEPPLPAVQDQGMPL